MLIGGTPDEESHRHDSKPPKSRRRIAAHACHVTAEARDTARQAAGSHPLAAVDGHRGPSCEDERTTVLVFAEAPVLRGKACARLTDEHDVLLAERPIDLVEQTRRYLPEVVVLAMDATDRVRFVDLLSGLRAHADLAPIAVMALTTRGEAAERARLLDGGADDCMTWDCSDIELRARLRALARGRRLHRDLEHAKRHLALRLHRQASELARLTELTRLVPVSVATQQAFRCEGEYWTITYAGAAVRLKQSVGLRYLAQLLARPHVEVPAVVLAASTSDSPSPAPTRARLDAGGFGGASRRMPAGDATGFALIDARAQAAYRRRLDDLRELRDEADAFGDDERKARVGQEIEALSRELARAIGLGGRDRRTAHAAEKARLNVTRAIRTVIARMKAHHQPLAWQLSASVRTGTFCCYEPPPGTEARWDIG